MNARSVSIVFIFLWIVGAPVLGQDVASDLLGRINTLRGGLGLAPYTINSALASAAQSHAQWMAITQQVTHVQSDGSRPRDRAVAAGYNSSWVSENIYMGGLAGVNDAWNFWLNSPIHYGGLTSTNYQHIGIGTAQGAGGQAFVLVFGVPGGSTGNSAPSNTAGSNNAALAQPSYIVGVDSVGNIMHQVQPGDTLGNILLTYGYTWDDLPALLELNEMTEEDIRFLAVDSVLLVPPKAGTYTPQPPTQVTAEVTEESINSTPATPEPAATNALIAPATYIFASATPPQATATQPALPTYTSTTSIVIHVLPTATVAQSPERISTPSSGYGRPPVWLIGAIVIQVGVLGYATLEFLRRLR